MIGRPIFAGPSKDGPFCIIEGPHRCYELLAANQALMPPTIKVLVGICPTITDWWMWR